MHKLRSLTAALACLGAFSFANPASAGVMWNWSFNNGAEAGTFQTNGNVSDLAGSFNFTIDINSFQVTASAFAPALVGAAFFENQPTQGFLWSGTTATQFYRGSGAFTNGSNFFSGVNRVLFAISGSPIAQTSNNSNFTNNGFTALTLIGGSVTPPGGGGTVPEPATLSLLALGAAGFAARRRKAA